MSAELQRSWEAHAQAASAWREGEPITPVLEALALSVALEVTGGLADVPRPAREALRRIGQRALLHAGAEPRRDEDEDEALRITLALARDGLRALSGRAEGPEPAVAAEPSARDLARLRSGRIDPFEAASIARRARRSARAREELAWSARLEGRDGARAPLRLAAADFAASDAAPMRDPADGRLVASAADPETGAPLVEVYAFGEPVTGDLSATERAPDEIGLIELSAYATRDAPVRLEGASVRTASMQPGYWSGTLDTSALIPGGGSAGRVYALSLFVGEERFAIEVDLSA